MADKLLKSITFPDLADRYIVGDTSLSVSGAGADSKTVGDALATKADNDGSYSNMTVGNAEQLVSNVKVNDKTPYIFRTSGGSVDIGDREYINGIVGGTVAWNQLVGSITSISNTGGTVTTSGSVATFTANAEGQQAYLVAACVASHKYLFSATYKTTNPTNVKVRAFAADHEGKNTTDWQTTYGISTTTESTGKSIGVIDRRTSGWDAIQIKNIQCFDLTQMFGTTIADYIYSLETANAGAGVAWFKKLFNKPYYAYNAGELKSVSGLVSHDMTGFNQWDEEWESGAISASTGNPTTNANYSRSKNFCKILPSTSYYRGSSNVTNFGMFFYDADKKYIGVNYYSTPQVFTTPSNAYYFKVHWEGTSYGNNICINLSWDGSRNGEYEPYVKHSYPLDSDLTLRGIPKLDANNSLYYDGDVYEADGTVTRKYGIVDLGTLTWSRTATSSGNYRWQAGKSGVKASASNNSKPNFICPKYMSATPNEIYLGVTGISSNTTDGIIFICDASLNDLTGEQVKTALSGTYLIYELATPTTETADAYVGTQIVNDFGTEEYVISDGTFAVPVGHDTDYPINLVAKLEMAPNSPEGNGDYIVRQVNGENSYVPLVIEDALPTIPSTAGSYKLTVTVAEGADPVLSWEAE